MVDRKQKIRLSLITGSITFISLLILALFNLVDSYPFYFWINLFIISSVLAYVAMELNIK